MGEIHLLNPMFTANGGSEWRTYSLFKLLAEHAPVTIWAIDTPDKELFGKWPIRVVNLTRGVTPRGGTFVFVGVFYELPAWLVKAAIQRAIIIHNVPGPLFLKRAVEKLRQFGVDKIEIVTASDALQSELEGVDAIHAGTEPSWIDISRFCPLPKRPVGPPVIGRMSRDRRFKFHENDPALFLHLAESGFRLRLMGASCLSEELGAHPNIEFLAEGAEPAEDFLRSLDVFLYRTSDRWFESFGRIIVEAMASGVVPVAHERGGYADVIESGRDGVLYESEEEAVEWLHRLRSEPGLKEEMGSAARKKVEALYGSEAKERLIEFYTRA